MASLLFATNFVVLSAFCMLLGWAGAGLMIYWHMRIWASQLFNDGLDWEMLVRLGC